MSAADVGEIRFPLLFVWHSGNGYGKRRSLVGQVVTPNNRKEEITS